MRFWVFHQDFWRVIFENLPLSEYKYLVTPDDGVNPVRDRDHCAILELLLDQLLNLLFCHDVDICGGFVQDDDFVLGKNRSTDADQLLLARTQVGSSLSNLEVDTSALLLVLVTLKYRAM